jgi:hypothetical protein
MPWRQDMEKHSETSKNSKVIKEENIGKTEFLKGLSSSPFYGLATAFSNTAIPLKDRLRPENVKMIFFGCLSGLLYAELFRFQIVINHFAELTREGEKIDFLIPIGIAFLFSYVHGAFATYSWQSLGLKVKDELGKEQAWTPYIS